MDQKNKNDILEQFERVHISKLPVELQQKIKTIQAVFSELSKLMKSLVLYGAHHQSAMVFRSKFFEALTQALIQYPVIDVDLQQYELLVNEQLVFSDEKATGLYQFYADGIRALSFKEGMTLKEVDQLLNLILLDWSNPALFEDDAVTMLWKAQFKHFSYRIAQSYHENSQEIEEGKSNQAYEKRLDEIFSKIQRGKKRSFHCVKNKQSNSLDQINQKQQALHQRVHQRETLEKLVELSLVTQKSNLSQQQQQQISQRDRLINLFDQLSLVFLGQLDLSNQERLIRQLWQKAELPVKNAILERWTTPHYIEKILLPLYTKDEILMAHQFDDRQALLTQIEGNLINTEQGEKNKYTATIMSILSLLSPQMLPALSLHIGKVKKQYEKPLIQLMIPYVNQYQIELCRPLLQGEENQCLRILDAIYQSKQTQLIIKAFQTLLQNPNSQLKLEALKRLPNHLYQACYTSITELAKDLSPKLCSQALYLLSQLSTIAQPSNSLVQFVKTPEFELFQLAEKRKLFATLAYHRIDPSFFVELLNQGGLFSQGDDKQQAALIGLAICYSLSPKAELKAILEKNAKKLTGALLKAGGQWGLRYIEGDQKQRDGMKFILYMLSSIDEQGKSI